MKTFKKALFNITVFVSIIMFVFSCSMDKLTIDIDEGSNSTEDNIIANKPADENEPNVHAYTPVGLTALSSSKLPSNQNGLAENEIGQVAIQTLGLLAKGQFAVYQEILSDFLGLIYERPIDENQNSRTLQVSHTLSLEHEKFSNIKAAHEFGLQSDVEMTIDYLEVYLKGGVNSVSALRDLITEKGHDVDTMYDAHLKISTKEKLETDTPTGKFEMLSSIFMDIKLENDATNKLTLQGKLQFSAASSHVLRNKSIVPVPLAIKLEIAPFSNVPLQDLKTILENADQNDLDTMWNALRNLIWGESATNCISLSFESVNPAQTQFTIQMRDKDAFNIFIPVFRNEASGTNQPETYLTMQFYDVDTDELIYNITLMTGIKDAVHTLLMNNIEAIEMEPLTALYVEITPHQDDPQRKEVYGGHILTALEGEYIFEGKVDHDESRLGIIMIGTLENPPPMVLNPDLLNFNYFELNTDCFIAVDSGYRGESMNNQTVTINKFIFNDHIVEGSIWVSNYLFEKWDRDQENLLETHDVNLSIEFVAKKTPLIQIKEHKLVLVLDQDTRETNFYPEGLRTYGLNYIFHPYSIPEGMCLIGWATNATTNEAEYSADDIFIMPGHDITLYAIIEECQNPD